MIILGRPVSIIIIIIMIIIIIIMTATTIIIRFKIVILSTQAF